MDRGQRADWGQRVGGEHGKLVLGYLEPWGGFLEQ